MPGALDFSPTLDKVLMIAAIDELAPMPGLLGAEFCPLVPYDSTLIEFDIVMSGTGLLGGYGMDEDLKVERWPGVSTIKMETPVHRGYYPIVESQLKRLRRPGTRESANTLDEIAIKASTWLRRRAEATIENGRWRMFEGSYAVRMDDGASDTVNYRMPPTLNETLTGTSQWDDYTNSDPLNDIQKMIEYLAEFGTDPARIVYGWRVNRYLVHNAKIRSLIQSQAGRDLLAAGQIPQGTLAGLPHQMYTRTYGARDYLGAAYTTGTSVTLEDGDVGQLADLGAGDRIVFGPSSHANNPRAKESVTVSASPISGTTLTIDSALTLDYAINDPVTWFRPYCHPDDFYIFPQDDGEPWCEYWTVPSIHNNNEPGIYVKSKIDVTDIPFKGWVKGGIDGLPIMFRQGRHGRYRTT